MLVLTPLEWTQIDIDGLGRCHSAGSMASWLIFYGGFSMDTESVAKKLIDLWDLKLTKRKDKVQKAGRYLSQTTLADEVSKEAFSLRTQIPEILTPSMNPDHVARDIFTQLQPKKVQVNWDFAFRGFDPNKHVLFQNKVRHKKGEPQYLVYDTVENSVPELSWENLSHGMDKDEKASYVANAKAIGHRVYIPSEDSKPREVRRGDLVWYELTTYRKPKWKTLEPTGKPTTFLEFMEHFFPVAEERKQVFYWLNYAVFDRCESYLYLTGGIGAGKSTLAEYLAQLVGESNYNYSKGDFTSNHFNGYLENSKLIVVEEFDTKGPKEHEAKNTLKRLANTQIQVESKGVNQKTVTNYCSFIMMNNDGSKVLIRPDDRRFSIPVVCDTDLKEAKGHEFATLLNEELGDLQVICNIAHYIRDNFSDGAIPKTNTIKGARFEMCCYESRGEGIKFLVDYLLETDRETYSHIVTSFGKDRVAHNGVGKMRSIFPTVKTIEEFFKYFTWKGKPFATITPDPDKKKEYILERIN